MEKRLFKFLKNGKVISLFYKKTEDLSYTIHLQYRNEIFVIHYYLFDGNNVFDEENYKDEHVIEKEGFNDFLDFVNERFPGLSKNWNH